MYEFQDECMKFSHGLCLVNWLQQKPSLVKDDQGAAADTSLEGREVICGKRTNRKDSVRAR